jgi:DUF1680 family protein
MNVTRLALFMLGMLTMVGGPHTSLLPGVTAAENDRRRIAADASSVLCFGNWTRPGQAAKAKDQKAKPAPKPSALDLELDDPTKAAPQVSYDRSARQSDSPGSWCQLRFKGDSVRCLGGKGPNLGLADLVVDGKLVKTVDAYAAEAKTGQVLFEVTGLDPSTTHELRYTIRRDMNGKSSGRLQIIEGFDVAEAVDYVQWLVVQGAEEMAKIVAGEKNYLKPGQWKPVPYAAVAPSSGVTLDGGPMRQCLDRNLDYLNRWYEKKNKYQGQIPSIGWDRHLPASSEGRMLGGAGHTLRWGEREDMRAIVDAVVAVVKARQRPDGYCLPYDEKTMQGGGGAWNDERRNYDRCHLTRGMVAAAVAGNQDALPIMRKFYDWLNASPYSTRLLSGPYNGSSHNCNNGHEGSLCMYFSPVGKPDDLVAVERYFVQDFFIEESRKADPLSLCYYPYHTPHSYVLLAYNAWLDHYRATGASKYLEAAKGAWQMLNDNYIHIGGSLAICEARGGSYPPRSYLLDKKHHTGETCGSVFWVDINHKLLQFFPDDAKYADAIETTMINVMQAVQDPTGNIRYHTCMVGTKHGPTFENTCCEVFGSPFFGRMPEFIYSLAPDGLYVNLYAPSTIKWQQGGVATTLAVTTDYPVNGKVTMTVRVPSTVTMAVRLRIPGWVKGDVAIAVNGKPEVTGQPGRFVSLRRTWKDGDQIAFELPMSFRTERYTGIEQDPNRDRYALLYGPVLLALTGATNLDIPPAKLPQHLRQADGKPLHFTVDGVQGVEYRPYWPIQGESFTCFPTMP